MVKGSYISIITLNVNEFYAPTKRHGLVEWIQKHELCISCLQETHFRLRDTYRLKVRGWKKILCKWKLKAGVAILILDKIDFKIKTITRDKEGHYIMIKPHRNCGRRNHAANRNNGGNRHIGTYRYNRAIYAANRR